MKINKRTAICFGIFLVLFLTTVGNAAAVLEEGTETRITTSGSASNPAIYEDKIVWQDTRNGGNDVYMYDTSTEKETRITTSGSAVNPVIYGNMIVWSDGRNGNDRDIYTYDLSTKQETRITTSGNAFNPDIYDNKIVYQNSGISLYDLTTKKVTKIANDSYDENDYSSSSVTSSNPIIYGNRIAWISTYSFCDSIDCSQSDQLLAYDLSTMKEISIDSDDSDMFFGFYIPSYEICNNIVWVKEYYNQMVYNGPTISMYDFSTKKYTQIKDGSEYAIYNNLQIYDNRLVWENDIYNSNIIMYDLSTKKETQVSTGGSASNPAIYGDRIVWQDNRNGNLDIYMFTLSSNEVPELPVADFSANTTEGFAPLTVQFNDLSENATEWDWDFGDGATSIEQNTVHTYSAAGNYTVNLTVSNSNGTDSKLATITVLAQPVLLSAFPGYTNPPTDLDQNGLYEDIHGNEMLDFDDVVAYYDNMDWIEENAPLELFDYNNNGLIDFDDVVKLYDML
jgi:beta propeller repeat protein